MRNFNPQEYLQKEEFNDTETLGDLYNILLEDDEVNQANISDVTKFIMSNGISVNEILKDIGTVVWEGMFYHRQEFTEKKLILPSNIMIIGDLSFTNVNLESVKGQNVNTIMSMAFAGCKNLKTVEFPNLEEIWTYAFSQCENFENFTVPESTHAIYKGAFNECPNLNLKLPNILRDYCSEATLADIERNVKSLTFY